MSQIADGLQRGSRLQVLEAGDGQMLDDDVEMRRRKIFQRRLFSGKSVSGCLPCGRKEGPLIVETWKQQQGPAL